MKDDHGFTLIELVLVVMLIGILSAGSIFGTRYLGFGSAKSTVERINAILDYVQVENMTKKESYYLIIRKLASGNYQMSVETNGKVISSEELDLVRGEINYRVKEDSNRYLVSNDPVVGRVVSDKLEICFEKDSGGLRTNRPPQAVTVTQIEVTSAGRTYTIRLVEITGKHYIER